MHEVAEDWRAVRDFPAYEVSSLGRVRKLQKGRFVLLKGSYNYVGGHIKISFRKTGHKKYVYVHRLVHEAFIGPIPRNLHVRHLDGDSQNNAVANLRAGTARENAADRSRHGTLLYGGRHPGAKISDADAVSIRSQLSEGCKQKDLALFYGVARPTIASVAQGRSHRKGALPKGNTYGDRRFYRTLAR